MKTQSRRLFAVLLSLLMIIGLTPMLAAAEDTGFTEVDGEYWITSAAGLSTFADEVTGGNDFAGKVVNLGADITAAEDYTGAGAFSSIASNIKSFSGTLNGGGHTITLAVDASYSAAAGLGIINDLGETGLVKDLNVAGSIAGTSTASGNLYIGSVVGCNRGTIQNCFSTASVTNTSNSYASVYAGGIAGANKGTIEDCSAAGSVTGTHPNTGSCYLGGITGQMAAGSVTAGCVYSGSSVSSQSAAAGKISYVGGIAGQTQAIGTTTISVLKNCHVAGTSVTGYHAGGIAGQASSRVLNNYSTATVSGTKSTAGIVAQSSANTVLRNNYFAGSFGEEAAAPGAVISTLTNKGTAQNNYVLAGTAENFAAADTGGGAKDNAFFAADGTLTWQDGASVIVPADESGTALETTIEISEVKDLLTALQTWQANSAEGAFEPWTAGSQYPVFGEAAVIQPGDLDGDGAVSSEDVALLKKAVLGKAELTAEQLQAADFNDDGKITASDLLHLKKLAAGLI